VSDNNLDSNASFSPGGRAPAILIVDDDELVRMVLSDHLQDTGYVVQTASSGDEAKSVLEAGEIQYALVVTDIVMPGSMDGFQLADWVRRRRPSLPIILTSGYSKKARSAEELCPGVPFISKPYRLTDMARTIRSLLATKGSI
jgi:CheY-like chemotaxis protein